MWVICNGSTIERGGRRVKCSIGWYLSTWKIGGGKRCIT